MNILILDIDFEALDFALRCKSAGHDVRWFQCSAKSYNVGKGMGISIVADWRDHMRWARDGLIFITDNKKYLHDFDRYRDLGYKIFAPSVSSSELEIDRSKGMEVLKSCDISIPPYKQFGSLQDAKAFVEKSDDAWVFKTLGSDEDKSLTFVSGSPEEMIGWIDSHIRSGMKLKGPCILQEKIDILSEMCVLGIYGPNGFLEDKWLVGIEHKKLMNGEIGPNTGEMGTIQQYCAKDKLADETLVPVAPILKALGHCGFIDVNVAVDTKGRIWPLEFTSRPGWPQFYIQMAAHRGDPAQWMRDLLDGKDTLKVNYDVAVGVVLAQPDWPYSRWSADRVEGNPVIGYNEVGNDAHWVDIMMRDGKIETAAQYIACITSLGKTISSAREKVYRAVDKVKFPNMMYRTDIGEKVIDALPKLHRYGYLMEMRA